MAARASPVASVFISSSTSDAFGAGGSMPCRISMMPCAAASILSPREVLSSSTTRSCVSGMRISTVLNPLMPPLCEIVATSVLPSSSFSFFTAHPNA